jgi:uncharacterized protein (DUF1501 family)
MTSAPRTASPLPMNRRYFLKGASLGFAAFGFAPAFLNRALAQSTRAKTLVVIFQRGGADGLSMIAPVADGQYYRLRPNIAVPREKAVKLDDTFSLHPSLAALEPLYRQKTLAVIHGVASPAPTRSHFDAQDFIEAGTPGTKGSDGWLNRAVQLDGAPATPFRVVSISNQLPRSLLGSAPAVAMPSLADFRINAGKASAVASKSFESMYAQAVDAALRQSGTEAFDALSQVEAARLQDAPPQNGAKYPKG